MKDNKPLILAGAAGILFLMFGRKAFAKGTKKTKTVTVTPRVILPDGKPNRKWGIPMKLSKNFNLSEFLVTKDPVLQKKMRATKLTDTELQNVRSMTDNILQPLRDYIGKPIVITSGVRPVNIMTPDQWVEYLKKKGHRTASRTSDHFEGAGVDFYFRKGSAEDWRKAARWLAKNPHVRQVIIYWKTRGGKLVPGHMHVGLVRKGRPRFARAEKFAMAFKDGQLMPGAAHSMFGVA